MELSQLLNLSDIQQLLDRLREISGTSLWLRGGDGELLAESVSDGNLSPATEHPILFKNRMVGRVEGSGAEATGTVLALAADEVVQRLKYQVDTDDLAEHITENYQELNCLFEVIQHLPSMSGLDVIANCSAILKATSRLVGAQRSWLLISEEEKDDLILLEQLGGEEITQRRYTMDTKHPGPWEHTFGTSGVLNAACLEDLPEGISLREDLGLCMPLISVRLEAAEKPLGTFCFCGKSDIDFFSSTEVKLATVIAAHTASLLSNAQLFENVRDLFLSAISALSNAIESKDDYTFGHVERVTEYSASIAIEMGFDPEHVEQVRIAAMMHDLGKIGTPDHILLKKGRLTDEERAVMQEHTLIGPRILKGIRQLQHLVPWIQSHHERLDGKGYPLGLKGDEIPLEAQILTVADSFDAMTSNRSYRSALPIEEACRRLREGCGTQFSETVVEAFLRTEAYSDLLTSGP